MRATAYARPTYERTDAIAIRHPMPPGEQEAFRAAFDLIAGLLGLEMGSAEGQLAYEVGRRMWHESYMHGLTVRAAQARAEMGEG